MHNKQLILIRLADDKFILIKFILCSEKKMKDPSIVCTRLISTNYMRICSLKFILHLYA